MHIKDGDIFVSKHESHVVLEILSSDYDHHKGYTEYLVKLVNEAQAWWLREWQLLDDYEPISEQAHPALWVLYGPTR